jgi:dipeptidyl aminopeptidase/acylaminoacyl peptidase
VSNPCHSCPKSQAGVQPSSQTYLFKMKKIIFFLVLTILQIQIFGQKRALDFDDYKVWNRLEQPQISSNGQFVAYSLAKVTEGDGKVGLYFSETGKTLEWPRGVEPRFSDDAKFLFFKIKPALDSIKYDKRKKKKEEDWPKDSLAIFNLEKQVLIKIAAVKNFAVPKNWNDYLIFELEPRKIEPKKDTSAAAKSKPKNLKKEGKENGNTLIIRQLSTETQDTIPFVIEFILAENAPNLAFISTGRDSIFQNGAYLFDFQNKKTKPLARGRGTIKNLVFDKMGTELAFVTDFDTSKAQLRRFDLWFWEAKNAAFSGDSAQQILTDRAPFSLPDAQKLVDSPEWLVSQHTKPMFSDDGKRLFFGLAPIPILPDTTRLSDETVRVEVWSWTEKDLHTQQENRLEEDKKRSFWAVFEADSKKIKPVCSPQYPNLILENKKNTDLCILIDPEPYKKESGWEGADSRDFYVKNLKNENDEVRLFAKNVRGSTPQISPNGRFAAWFSERDSAWFSFDFTNNLSVKLTQNTSVKFFDEEADTPDFPNAHGAAGWLADESGFLVYDKFDIWLLDPKNKRAPERLTNGRKANQTYRYLKIDSEEKSIPTEKNWLLSNFRHENEYRRMSGYQIYNLKNRQIGESMIGKNSFSQIPLKSEQAESIVFSMADFNYQFWFFLKNWTDFSFKTDTIAFFCDPNPQQVNYFWGSSELVEWISPAGDSLTGMLFKPEDFRADRQYPMIVNFYERSSDALNMYRAIEPGRSQICYPYYTSRGYLVFNPDIRYKIGHPGASAEDAVISGVEHLIKKGFVARDRIGLQGHSWGGYQVAHILTKTNLFRCAESGAPVVNMTSAYGGIRWESGLSRIFQYEHTQSRIGATLWQKPELFIENSPLFALDKVTTPVLILHNDKDGAVPWQQGIEYFVGLRRLGKPCWLLNYNDEPHWPVKMQNRLDFQLRMQQFFDHFLKDAPEPCWMKKGVSAMEKSEKLNLETNCED